MTINDYSNNKMIKATRKIPICPGEKKDKKILVKKSDIWLRCKGP